MLFFLTDAQCRVWYLDQVNSGIQTDLPGVCAGIVIRWVNLRAKGSDFGTRAFEHGLEVIMTEADKNEILGAQNRLESLRGRKGYEKILHDTNFKLPKQGTHKISASGQIYQDFQLTSIAQHVNGQAGASPTVVARTPHAWFLMRMRPSKQGSGHVVAIEVSGAGGQRSFRLMDPSNGCFSFNDEPSFGQWLLGDFFAKTGYRELYPGFVKLHRVAPREFSERVTSFFSSLF